MTIHTDHPFLGDDRDPVRQLRGRLGGTVSLWTSGDEDGRAGLTVSSVLVAPGEPGQLLGLLDPDSDLLEALTSTGRAVVQLLRWEHRMLADQFAGVAPAPGGPFRQTDWTPTSWGPRLADAGTWAGVLLEDDREVGWSRLVTCRVEHVEIAEDIDPLVHQRGRYQRPG
ncbi:flavin reductase family protein [Nocardioides limicola]|uniref:flavin reductase family protein n=1 Tax=Nocardioides limicola TaxID=2803368 RepID=UPI00193BF4A7|nr:flavin reductase family protein [Nocardioides sp. DJM-14]